MKYLFAKRVLVVPFLALAGMVITASVANQHARESTHLTCTAENASGTQGYVVYAGALLASALFLAAASGVRRWLRPDAGHPRLMGLAGSGGRPSLKHPSDAAHECRCTHADTCPIGSAANRTIRLTSSMAHELGQPLSAMRAYLGAIERLPPDSPDVAESLKALQQQAQRASEIVKRLRFLAEGQRPRLAQVELDALIEEALQQVRVTAMREGVAIHFQRAAGLRRLHADPVLIQGVLRNLLDNALKALATLPRPVPRAIILDVSGDETHYKVTVSDTGPGLPNDGGEALFDPFVSRSDSGLGIGLAICRQVVEAHGGRISASARPGGGASFSFTLLRPTEYMA